MKNGLTNWMTYTKKNLAEVPARYSKKYKKFFKGREDFGEYVKSNFILKYKKFLGASFFVKI